MVVVFYFSIMIFPLCMLRFADAEIAATLVVCICICSYASDRRIRLFAKSKFSNWFRGVHCSPCFLSDVEVFIIQSTTRKERVMVSSVVWHLPSFWMHLSIVFYTGISSVVRRMNLGWCWWSQAHHSVEQGSIRFFCSHCQNLSHNQRNWCIATNSIQLIFHWLSVVFRFGRYIINYHETQTADLRSWASTEPFIHFSNTVKKVSWY